MFKNHIQHTAAPTMTTKAEKKTIAFACQLKSALSLSHSYSISIGDNVKISMCRLTYLFSFTEPSNALEWKRWKFQSEEKNIVHSIYIWVEFIKCTFYVNYMTATSYRNEKNNNKIHTNEFD